MNAIRFETTVDEAVAAALPGLRPLLGKRVELIALQTEADSVAVPKRTLTVDELFSRRLDAPPGAAPLTEEDIQRAILEGALRGNV